MSFEGNCELDTAYSPLGAPDSAQFTMPLSVESCDLDNVNTQTDVNTGSSDPLDNDACEQTNLHNIVEVTASTLEPDIETGYWGTRSKSSPHAQCDRIQTRHSGSSSESSPQSQSDSQTANVDSLTFRLLDMKSESSSTGNSSDGLSPLRLLDSEALSSSNSPPDFWLQSATSSDEYLHELSDTFNSSTSDLPTECKTNALRYPPCIICTGKSSGLHYGCYTCEACKNFFRRYLLRSGGFSCKKNNNCVIGNRSRGNCSGCRLRKCLDVGMSKEKSKIGRYTHFQRTETIREVNKLEGKSYIDEVEIKEEKDFDAVPMDVTDKMNGICRSKTASDATAGSEANILTESERQLLDMLIGKMDAIEHFSEKGKTAEGREQIIKEHYDRYLAKIKLIGSLKAIPKEEYFILLKIYNIDLDGRWNLFKQEANNCAHIVERYCTFAYSIPGFQTVSMKDQEILLKIGHCEFFVILMHEGYDHARQIFLEMNGVPSHVEEAADKIFSRVLIEMQCDIYRRWQKANLLNEEKALLCAMSLLCSDRVNLENAKSVENIHLMLTGILMKVLHIHYGKDAQKRFSKFIDILTFCRQASDAYFKEYQEMSQLDMIQEVAPAFPTLCPEKF